MGSVEDQVRAAARAQAQTLREVRPLRLPAPPAAAPARRPAWERRWRGWLAPLTAAALVIAVAVTLVTVRHSPNGRTVPSTATGGVPRYYVALHGGPGLAGLLVGDTFTGATLAVIPPPINTVFAGVTGAADDRTFVVSTYSTFHDRFHPSMLVTWYLLRITPGRKLGYRLARLPVPDVRSFTVQAIALSRSGRELAMTAVPGAGYQHHKTWVMRIYSVATGKLLRSWSADESTAAYQGGNYPGFQGAPLSWADGDRAVIFGTLLPSTSRPAAKNAPRQTERLIDVTAKSGDLISASRVLWPMPVTAGPHAPEGCKVGTPVVSADGKTVACVTKPMWRGNQPRATHVWLAYSTSTPTVPRFLYQATVKGPLAHATGAWVLWIDRSGGTMIIEWQQGVANGRSHAHFGVLSHGRFRPIPPVHLSPSVLSPVVAW